MNTENVIQSTSASLESKTATIPGSLTLLVDWLNAVVFAGRKQMQEEGKRLAAWIVEQHDQSRQYLGFCLQPQEQDAFRLFSGERLRTRIGASSVLGLEASRALLLLDPFAPHVQQVLRTTHRRLETACYANGCMLGECAHASIAVLRYLAVDRVGDAEERLTAGIAQIQANRTGSGQWKNFPFYYTLLAMTEISDLSGREMQYAAARCENLLRRKGQQDLYTLRRRQIMEKVLSLV